MNPEDYNPIKGTSIKLVSLSGQLIQYLRNSDTTGEILKCEVEQLKNGGTDIITFSVDRRTNIPTFPGMIVEIYKDGEKFAIGYSNTIPQPQSTKAELVVECLGFMHKLKLKVLNKTYSSITLSNIVADLESLLLEVDIIYDVSKITLPNITVTDLVFDDKTLSEVIETILQIANVDYNNEQYRWFIGNDKKLNFSLISQTAERTIFEGFNYQSPEVEEDENNIINKIFAYKTDEVETKELTFVAIYEDTDSQGKYGVRDKKIVFPDFIDDTTLSNFCNGIIEKEKEPQTKVLIEDLEGVDFPFSFYKLSDRIDFYWQLLSECDSFDDWDISAAVDTTVTLSTEQVLTGRRSIKCVTEDGSFNEFIQYNAPTPVYGPSLFRFYLFLEEAMNLEVTLIGTDDIEYTFTLGVGDFNIEVNKTVSIVKKLEVTKTVGSSNYGSGNYGGSNYGG